MHLSAVFSFLLSCSSLYPNVDFYSGIVLRALGIPVEMYTVLFAMARTVGWTAQVRGWVGVLEAGVQGDLMRWQMLDGDSAAFLPAVRPQPSSLPECLSRSHPCPSPAVEGDGG